MVMVVTTFPYLIAFQRAMSQDQGVPWRFSGFVFGVEDGNSYIAKMRRGMEGEWLFHSPYSGMEQGGLIAFLPYYLLGKLAGGSASHEQLVVLFHWFRFGAGILNIIATYLFISEYLRGGLWRQVALVMITSGGGLGWVVLLFPNSQVLPLEFYSPEAFGFLSLYGLPHLSLARAFMLLSLREVLRFWSPDEFQSAKGHGWRLGFYWLGAGLSQPIHAVIIGVIVALYYGFVWIRQFLRKSRVTGEQSFWRMVTSIGLASLPALVLVVYTGIRFITDPYLRIWASQNRLPAAPISLYLLSYGWLIPFVFGGIKKVLKDGDERGFVLILWLLVASTLIFTPISIQRRLIEGIWVGLILLSVIFLEPYAENLSKGMHLRGVSSLLVICALPSSILLIWGGIQSARFPQPPIFIPEWEAVGYEALNQLEQAKDTLVLASYDSSNALPAYAFVRVLVGHGPESPFVDRMTEKVETFYHGQTSDSFRLDFIRENQIEFIVWGENERKLGDWQPLLETYLKPVYEDGEFIIFRVDWTKMEN